jgi:AcrR family transcriptional regulator
MRTPSRVGRPPRVTRAEIADAALSIGLDRATIRNVAAKLHMSVPGLYHHVRTRDDLLALAAAHSLGAVQLPADTGQSMTDWLTAYARFVYDALVAQPELVGQILAGTVNTMRQAQHLERFFEVLTARGATTDDAYRAYELLMAAVIGAAASAIGHAAATGAGHPPDVDLRRAAEAFGADQVPLVAALTRRRRRPTDLFDTVRLTIDHIAAS